MLKIKRSSGTAFESGLHPDLVRPFQPKIVFSQADRSEGCISADSPCRVLIVEDDYLVSIEMEIELAAAGFEVVGVAVSARQAIQIATATDPDLVIMDVRLEGLRDGVDAALDIFMAKGIRSLFASAHHDPETRRRAEAALPLGWLAKPYTMTSLVNAVREAARHLRKPD